jgi:hypothetical protein
MMEILEQEYRERKHIELQEEDHLEEEMIMKARKELALQMQQEREEEERKRNMREQAEAKRERRRSILEVEIVKKAFKEDPSKERIDKSILFTGNNHDTLLGFYFDKFNLHKRDLNPFLSKDKIGDYLFKASCRQSEKNLSRRVITIR